jgi:hypothetical protein
VLDSSKSGHLKNLNVTSLDGTSSDDISETLGGKTSKSCPQSRCYSTTLATEDNIIGT